MKIIVIGATGNLGTAVTTLLKQKHTVVSVGRRQGDYQIDILKPQDVEALFQEIGPFDALVSTVGKVHFAPLEDMTPDLYEMGLHNKLLGQVNLVLIGRKYIRPQGSFTLTSGVLGSRPVKTASSAMMVNKAIEGFAISSAFELAGKCRVNVVSPTIIEESMPEGGGLFKGFTPIPGKKAAEGYLKSIEGKETGKIYEIFD